MENHFHEAWDIQHTQEETFCVANLDIYEQCLIQSNKGWNGGTKDIASRIQGIYQFASDYYHATSHSIAAKEIVVFDKLAYSIQIYNVIVCIAKSLDIQYEDKN